MAVRTINIADKETLDKLEQLVDELVTSLQDTTNSINTITSNIKVINTNVSNIKLTQDDEDVTLTDVKAKLTDVVDRLSLIETSITNNSNNVSNIKNNVTYIKDNMNDLITAMTTVSTEMSLVKTSTSRMTEARAKIIDNIGSSDDVGGTISSGTLMSKLNKMIGMLVANFDNWNNVRAGYIDNIKESTEKLDDVDFNNIPAINNIQSGVINASSTLIARKDETIITNIDGSSPFYIDVTLSENVNPLKSEITVSYFDSNNSTITLPAKFLAKDKFRFYIGSDNSSSITMNPVYGYFWTVKEYK